MSKLKKYLPKLYVCDDSIVICWGVFRLSASVFYLSLGITSTLNYPTKTLPNEPKRFYLAASLFIIHFEIDIGG